MLRSKEEGDGYSGEQRGLEVTRRWSFEAHDNQVPGLHSLHRNSLVLRDLMLQQAAISNFKP